MLSSCYSNDITISLKYAGFAQSWNQEFESSLRHVLQKSNFCFRDTLVVAVINGATSIFAGFVVFSFLGYLSYELEEPIEDVATSGSYFNIVTRTISIDRSSYQRVSISKKMAEMATKGRSTLINFFYSF